MRTTTKLFKPLIVISVVMLALSMGCNNQPTANESDAETPTTEMDEARASVDEPPFARGEELYISYCAICHGEDGKGNGPMADMLTAAPANLTTIAMRRDGAYPNDEVYKIIDGQVNVPGHGTEEMPIWGKTFQESEQLEDQEEVEERINNLVAYLESIQVKNEQQ